MRIPLFSRDDYNQYGKQNNDRQCDQYIEPYAIKNPEYVLKKYHEVKTRQLNSIVLAKDLPLLTI